MSRVNYGEDIKGDPLYADIDSRDDGRYRVGYDSIPDDPALAIVRAISAITRTDPLELEPLHTAIDPDALDRSFSTTGNASQFSFRYVNLEMTVDNSGTIVRKQPPDGTGRQIRTDT